MRQRNHPKKFQITFRSDMLIKSAFIFKLFTFLKAKVKVNCRSGENGMSVQSWSNFLATK